MAQQQALDLADSPVDDDEVLLRRTMAQGHCVRAPDGVVHISSSAFSDRKGEPSVNRQRLLVDVVLPANGDTDTTDRAHAFTQEGEAHGVLSLVAHKVRSVEVDTCDAKGRPLSKHLADVVPQPRTENLSHAVIIARPEVAGKTHRRFLERLARIARVEVLPADLR